MKQEKKHSRKKTTKQKLKEKQKINNDKYTTKWQNQMEKRYTTRKEEDGIIEPTQARQPNTV